MPTPATDFINSLNADDLRKQIATLDTEVESLRALLRTVAAREAAVKRQAAAQEHRLARESKMAAMQARAAKRREPAHAA
jgi:hypothetical protein